MLRVLIPLAALATAAVAQAQPAPDPVLDSSSEMTCVANLLLFRAAATKSLEAPSLPEDKRAGAQRLLTDTNEALSWYLGRLALQPATVDLKAAYLEAVGKNITAKREDQVKQTFDCLTGATKARIAAAQRLLPDK